MWLAVVMKVLWLKLALLQCVLASPRGLWHKLDVYVITAEQSREVQTRWSKSLDKSSSTVHFVDPVYVKSPDVDKLVRGGTLTLSNYSSPLSGNESFKTSTIFLHELGCTLAHRHVWQRIDSDSKAAHSTWAAVFESDALLRSDFVQRAQELSQKLQYLDVDIIMMGHCCDECNQEPFSDLGGGVHLEPSVQAACMHAYLVSLSGARRLLEVTAPFRSAVDNMMINAVSAGRLLSMSVCPPISRQPWQSEERLWGLRGDFIQCAQGGIRPHPRGDWFIFWLLPGVRINMKYYLHVWSCFWLAVLVVTALVGWCAFYSTGKCRKTTAPIPEIASNRSQEVVESNPLLQGRE